MNLGVTARIDARKIAQKQKARFDDKALYILSQQILMDSNKYIRKDQGVLEASGIIHERGKSIAWVTPYARRVYYTGNPCRDVNPDASLMWFEKAKNVYSDDWVTLAERLMK